MTLPIALDIASLHTVAANSPLLILSVSCWQRPKTTVKSPPGLPA